MVEMAQATRAGRVRTNSDPRWRFQMPCPLPSHPGDWDKDGGSFFIDANQNLYKCFGCDQGPGSDGRGNAKKLYRLLFGAHYAIPRAHSTDQAGHEPSEAPPDEPKGYEIPEDTWDDVQEGHPDAPYVPLRYRQQRNDEFQPLRARLVGAYEEAGDMVAANKLSRCAIYFTPLSWGAGNVEGVPCHCNILGCPTCAFVRLHFLFKEKEDSLFHLTDPTIYLANNVFTLALPLGIEAKGDIFRLGVKAVRTLLTRAAQRKEVPALILHCVESFSCKVIDTDNGPVASFGVRLLGNWGEDNVAQLTAALQRVPPKLNHQLATRVSPVDDLALQVGEVRFADGPENSSPRAAIKALRANRRAASEGFQKLAVLAFGWEDNQDFFAWKVAQKRQKLVHGRGVFAKVSGSKPESPVPTGGMNPETGEMDTFIRHPNLVAPPHMWEAFLSEYTDRIHYRFKSGYSLENCVDFRSLPDDADGGGGGGLV